MKRLALLFVLSAVTAVLAAGCGGGGGESVSKGDVASVGSAHITRSQLDALLAQAQRSYKLQKRAFPKVGSPEYQTLQSQAIKYLVQRDEFSQKADELGIKITDKQFQARLKQVKLQCCGGSEKKYRAELAQQGVSDQEVQREVRDQLISEAIFKKVTSTAEVSDPDIAAYYTSHISQYTQPESRDVRHILVKTKGLADKLYSQIKGGADFAALAKKYSQDPGSKNAGGKLTISKGQTVPPFDKVAFSLKTNALSQPVHTQYGWHVIQALSPINATKKTPLSQVKAAIKQQLLQQKKNDSMQKWLNGLDKEFKPKIHYAQGYAPVSTGTTSTT
jgi:parvulin-like peptidyl-prolyl isomerase